MNLIPLLPQGTLDPHSLCTSGYKTTRQKAHERTTPRLIYTYGSSAPSTIPLRADPAKKEKRHKQTSRCFIFFSHDAKSSVRLRRLQTHTHEFMPSSSSSSCAWICIHSRPGQDRNGSVRKVPQLAISHRTSPMCVHEILAACNVGSLSVWFSATPTQRNAGQRR